jgi:tRNA (uracil-5-)-methyltransferase TRM9
MAENLVPSNKEIWDSISTSFDTTRKKPWTQIVRFLKTIEPEYTVIDIGCGNGRHLIEAIDKCSMLIGLDLSRNLLQIAKQKILIEKRTMIQFIQGTAANLPFATNSFDSALYIATVHTLRTRSERIQSLNELYRILKHGKEALISVWAKDQERFKEYFEKNKSSQNDLHDGDIIIYWRQHNLDIPRFYHLYTKDEFKKDLQEAGFTINLFEEATIASKSSVDNYFATVIKN